MDTQKTYITDILIVGAGPVGLFGVFAAGMLNLKTILIDSLSHLGGQCSALYPQKPIYDIPAHAQITGQELIDALVLQNAPFAPTYLLQQNITHLQRYDDSFEVQLSDHKVIAKIIIIAAGNGAFAHNKLLIPGAQSFDGKEILYKIDDIGLFEDKIVAIAGGGDSAVDWALAVAPIAKKAYMIHRRSDFRAIPQNVIKLTEAQKLEFVTPYQLKLCQVGKTHSLHLELENIQDPAQACTLEVDYLLPFFGLKADLGPIKTWGLPIMHNKIVVDPCTYTCAQNMYAVGDIAQYPGKLKLILTGFAEVTHAVHHAYATINGHKAKFEHSTARGLPNK